MSAFLFIANPSKIGELSDEELQERIITWKEHADNYNPDNKFESDRASGYRDNIKNAEAEIYCRRMNKDFNFDYMIACIRRGELDGGPEMRKAMAKSMSTGTAIIKLENGMPTLIESENEKP